MDSISYNSMLQQKAAYIKTFHRGKISTGDDIMPDKDAIKTHKALPDIIDYNLKLLFVGFNPGLYSAQVGHHYAGKSNRFWKLLYESDLTPQLIAPQEDRLLLRYGMGSVNIIDRPSKSSSELTTAEFRDGAASLKALIQEYRPKTVCYMGIGIYRAFASNILSIPKSRLTVTTGLQEINLIPGCIDYVCSNPSGLNTIPYADQLECLKGINRLNIH